MRNYRSIQEEKCDRTLFEELWGHKEGGTHDDLQVPERLGDLGTVHKHREGRRRSKVREWWLLLGCY